MSFLTKIFGDANEGYLKKLRPQVAKINSLEKTFKGFSDTQLREKSQALKGKIVGGEIVGGEASNILDEVLPEAFALIREAAKRTLNQRHFDVQLIGGMILHQGKIAEMKTGEGKTLTATLPVYLNALTGKGVHVVTVNDYLAKRDMVWMGQIYNLLGMSIGCIVHDAAYIYDSEYRQENSQLPISNSQTDERDVKRDLLGGFKVVESYLKPCLRKEAYACDITYGTNNEFGFDYLKDNMVYDLRQQVQRGHYFAIVDEVDSILIDEARTPLIISAPDMESSKWYQEFAKITPKLEAKTDYEIDEKLKAATMTEAGINKVEKILGAGNIYEEKGIKYVHHLEQALRAEVLFKRDKDYVVKPASPAGGDGQIIIVDEFTGRMMPGRRWSGGLHQAIEAKEGVRVQPESLTLASITFQNYFRMYEKISGMTGTASTSAEEFDKVYKLDVVMIPTNKPMQRKELPDGVYKTHDGKLKALVREIRERHEKGQPVLVGTTSIEKNEYLGKLLEREGVPHQILNAKHHEQEGEIIAQAGRLGAVTIATNMAGRGVDIIIGGNPEDDPERSRRVRELGGLHIIGTERHEARRIDNQLRGRAGRQGDPGSSQFFLSLEDDIMRIFGGDRIKSLMGLLKIPEDEAIENKMISGAIESAQSKIEGMNFDLRKHILEYDDVMNKHRDVIYKKRKEMLTISNWQLTINDWLETPEDKKAFEEKIKELGESFNEVAKTVALRTLDMFWMNHLEEMEILRDSVRLRAYGQRDPLVEYKSEGHRMFQRLLDTIESNIAQTMLKVSENSSRTNPVKEGVSRNDPCPCGAKHPDGRPIKYKHCHGK